jgi:hypothetical protein
MFLESIDKSAHLVVPQLNASIVKRSGQQWSRWMKGKPWRHDLSATEGNITFSL